MAKKSCRFYAHSTKKQVVEAYLAGESSISIGERMGIHSSLIRKWVKRDGYQVRIHCRSIDHSTKKQAVEAYMAGESSVSIGKRMEIHSSLIRKWVRRAGHQVRIRTEAQRRYALEEEALLISAPPHDLDPIQRLRQAQRDRGISDPALANQLQMSERQLKRIYGCERGRGKQFRESIEVLIAMRQALKLRWDEIFPED